MISTCPSCAHPPCKQQCCVRVLAAAKMQHLEIMYHALDKHVLSDDTKPETINHVSKYTRQSPDKLRAASSVLSHIPPQRSQITLWFRILAEEIYKR